ncbi:MAG: cobalamin biosynthesis protein CobQ [Oscillospiraceae bacterium]|nr:cobalamin biosynthesis protein CobQ [Oscillospiraceae bacterium]MBQ9209860.1 cobalamin biosynthesis protein CobQ [Oscillospiraceae bacterium]MBR4345870.1 cobalamin biosynthesis protein CobQ [Oscillospiraceae bacterium]
MKHITVITGHYGSGKTTFAANLAAKYRRQGAVRIVDMDTVNPYYRTADLSAFFEENDIAMTAPMYARSNLDIPSLDYDIPTLAEQSPLIIDLGGDDAGAYPVGKYAAYLDSTGYDMYYAVNFCRLLTHTPEEALDILREVESASRLRATAIVNNTNLGRETTEDTIVKGEALAGKLSEMAELPVLCTTAPDFLATDGDYCKVKILIKNIWEE